MISIGTNASALMAQAATASVQIDAETAMQRLSSGKRINAAKDDAAGVAIASRLTSHVRGLHQSIRNSMDAQALISTAQGGLQETEVLLQRIRELAVQASNDTNSDADRTNLNNEAQQLLAGIDAIASTTTWAGQNLLDGTYSNKSFQVGGGSMAADQLTANILGSQPSILNLNREETLISYEVNRETVIVYSDERPQERLTATTIENSKPISLGEATSVEFLSSAPTINAPQRVGSEFKINTSTTGHQAWSHLAVLQNGNIVAVWYGAQNGDNDIYGQIYDQSFNKLGSEFRINGQTAGDQYASSIAATDDGGFMVAWHSWSGQAPWELKVRTFNSNGAPLRAETNLYTSGNGGTNASLQKLSNGKFAIVYTYNNGPGNYNDVAGKIITASQYQGPEFILNSSTLGSQWSPEISELSNGGFMAVWGSRGWSTGGASGVFAQKFDDNGNRIGSEVQIHDGISRNGENEAPSITTLEDGKIVVSWTKSAGGIYAKILNVEGNVEADEFKVSHTNSASQSNIEALSDGGFVVTWQEIPVSASYPNVDIVGQRFNLEGEKVGAEFTVNSYTGNRHTSSNNLSLENGKFITSYSSEGQDGSGLGVYAQEFSISADVTKSTTITTSYKLIEQTQVTDETAVTLKTSQEASDSIKVLDTALQTINSQRAELGSLSNRLDHIIANNTNASTNTKASLGRIQDADFAAETTKLAKSKILEQSSTAMLAQANASVYEVLTLIPD